MKSPIKQGVKSVQVLFCGWVMAFAVSCFPAVMGVSLPVTSFAGTMRVQVYTEDRAPFNYLDENGQLSGVSTEIMRAVFRQANIEASFHVYPWARSLFIVQHTPDALIFSIARSKEREGKFIWVGELVPFDDWFYRADDRKDIAPKNVDDIKCGYVVCVVNKDIAEDLLQQADFVRGKNYIAVNSFNDCSRLVETHGVPLMVASYYYKEPEAENKVHQVSFKLDPVMRVPSLDKLNLYVAANPATSPALIDRLRKALEAIRRSGELDRIRQQFFVRFNAGSASASQ